LEHLDELEAERFMYECYRILVPGSTLKIYVPNGPVVCDGFKAAIDRRKDIHLLIYGIVGRENWTHKYLYDFHALSALFKRTGYVNTQNLTNLEKDHHDKAWGFMPGKVSLKMTGEKPR
jgi:predicted SAM-dependent methyltransferase